MVVVDSTYRFSRVVGLLLCHISFGYNPLDSPGAAHPVIKLVNPPF